MVDFLARKKQTLAHGVSSHSRLRHDPTMIGGCSCQSWCPFTTRSRGKCSFTKILMRCSLEWPILNIFQTIIKYLGRFFLHSLTCSVTQGRSADWQFNYESLQLYALVKHKVNGCKLPSYGMWTPVGRGKPKISLGDPDQKGTCFFQCLGGFSISQLMTPRLWNGMGSWELLYLYWKMEQLLCFCQMSTKDFGWNFSETAKSSTPPLSALISNYQHCCPIETPPKIIPSIPSIIPSTKRRVFRQSRPSISPSSVMSSFLGSVISRDQFSQEKISDLLCSQPCVEAFSWRPTKIEAGNTQVNGNKNLKPPLMDETPESYWTTGEVTFSTNIYVYIYHTIHISKCSFQIVEYPTISAMKTIPPKKLAQHSFCCKSRRYSNHGFP